MGSTRRPGQLQSHRFVTLTIMLMLIWITMGGGYTWAQDHATIQQLSRHHPVYLPWEQEQASVSGMARLLQDIYASTFEVQINDSSTPITSMKELESHILWYKSIFKNLNCVSTQALMSYHKQRSPHHDSNNIEFHSELSNIYLYGYCVGIFSAPYLNQEPHHQPVVIPHMIQVKQLHRIHNTLGYTRTFHDDGDNRIVFQRHFTDMFHVRQQLRSMDTVQHMTQLFQVLNQCLGHDQEKRRDTDRVNDCIDTLESSFIHPSFLFTSSVALVYVGFPTGFPTTPKQWVRNYLVLLKPFRFTLQSIDSESPRLASSELVSHECPHPVYHSLVLSQKAKPSPHCESYHQHVIVTWKLTDQTKFDDHITGTDHFIFNHNGKIISWESIIDMDSLERFFSSYRFSSNTTPTRQEEKERKQDEP